MKIFRIFRYIRGEEFITMWVFQLAISPLSLSGTVMNCIACIEIGQHSQRPMTMWYRHQHPLHPKQAANPNRRKTLIILLFYLYLMLFCFFNCRVILYQNVEENWKGYKLNGPLRGFRLIYKREIITCPRWTYFVFVGSRKWL